MQSTAGARDQQEGALLADLWEVAACVARLSASHLTVALVDKGAEVWEY